MLLLYKSNKIVSLKTLLCNHLDSIYLSLLQKKHTIWKSENKEETTEKQGFTNKKGAFRRPFYTRSSDPVEQRSLEVITKDTDTFGVCTIVADFD